MRRCQALSRPTFTYTNFLIGLHNLWNVDPAEALVAVRSYREWLGTDLERQRADLESLGMSFFPLDVLFDYGFVLGDAELGFLDDLIARLERMAAEDVVILDEREGPMSKEMVKMAPEKVAELTSLGTVEADEAQGVFRLHIDEPYRPALQGLDSCTHAMVFWWADRADSSDMDDLVVDLPYAPGVRSGVFANRSQARPNPICVTTAFILDVDEAEGIVTLAWIDAFDGTPILDIKPYMPMSDRVMSAEYPEWLKGFPASMEEAAEFFADPENAAMFE